MTEKYRLQKFNLIILDRGMISHEAIKDMLSLKQTFIAGLKKNEKLKREFLNINREEIYQPKYQVKLKNTTVYAKSFKYNSGTLIAVYNPAIEIAKREQAMSDKNYDHEEAKYMGYSLIFHTTEILDNEVVNLYFEKDKEESTTPSGEPKASFAFWVKTRGSDGTKQKLETESSMKDLTLTL